MEADYIQSLLEQFDGDTIFFSNLVVLYDGDL